MGMPRRSGSEPDMSLYIIITLAFRPDDDLFGFPADCCTDGQEASQFFTDGLLNT